MRVAGRVELTYRDDLTAERLLASVSVDNEGYVRTWRQGPTLIAEAEAESPGALRHTLEDLLACLSAAEDADSVADEDTTAE